MNKKIKSDTICGQFKEKLRKYYFIFANFTIKQEAKVAKKLLDLSKEDSKFRKKSKLENDLILG